MNRITEAALQLMEEVGVQGVTVGAVVERSETSVGSFYARFAGKDDLLRYLQESVWTEAASRWDGALAEVDWETLELESLVEAVVGLLVRSFRADYRRRRALGREWRQGEQGSRRVFEFHQHILATVTPLFLARGDAITHPDPEWAVRLGYRFAVGGIRELMEIEETAGIVDGGGTVEALVPEVARAWIAYLGGHREEKDPAQAQDVDFFDPWG